MSEAARAGSAPLPAPHPRGTWRFEAAVKDRAVEELVNLHWHRRLAFLLVRPLERIPAIKPNHITYLGTIIGLGAGAAAIHARHGGREWLAVASLLLFVCVVLDCADGMLARLRGGGTRFGMLLDGIADQVVGIAVWFGVSYASVPAVDAWWAWPLAVSVLPSIVLHCAIYDQLKVAFALGVASADVPKPPDLVAAGRFERGVDWLYQRVYGSIGDKLAAKRDPSIEPARFRAVAAPAMRLVTFLGLGTQLTIMYVAMAAGALDPAVPFWVAVLGIVIGLNVWTVVALGAWRRAQRALAVSP